MDLPESIVEWVTNDGVLLAHNAAFEMAIWEHILTPEFGWPKPKLRQWRDTQAAAALANLPLSLEGLAGIYKSAAQKDMEGSALMRSVAVANADPDTDGYLYPAMTDDQMTALMDYCEADVEATLNVWFRLPSMPDHELEAWHVDQKINHRGVCIDTDFVGHLALMAERRKLQLGNDVFRITGSLLANSTSTPSLKAWLKEEGVELPVTERKEGGATREVETLNKVAVNEMLARDDIEGAVREVLTNRVEANKSASLAKLKRVPNMIGSDGRLRGALRYSVAHTGRWASSGIQVHNLPKDKRDPEHRDRVLGYIREGSLDKLVATETRPLEAMSESLRAMIVAGAGKDLIGADYAAIEARVLAWLADDAALLDLFRSGADIYVKAAEDVGSDSRQLGKVCTLALGYGMGPIKFASTATSWGVPLDLKEARRVQRAWRDANSNIVNFWFELETAVRNAIENRGVKYEVGKLAVAADSRCLVIRLPSGRSIRYWRPRLRRATRMIPCVTPEGQIEERELDVSEIQFYTVGSNKSRMVQETTYGGKLVENVTQAVARDLLAHALVNLEAKGFPVVLHVHDSVVAEISHSDTRTVDEFCYHMTELPEWAFGCPVTAEGYRSLMFQG
jgi:DNA polymerase